MKTRVHDDVFMALGFDAEESADLRLRAELLIALQKRIRSSRLTQEKIAEKLEVKQPRVSEIMRGHVDLFSSDKLAKLLDRFGMRIEVRVVERRRNVA